MPLPPLFELHRTESPLLLPNAWDLGSQGRWRGGLVAHLLQIAMAVRSRRSCRPRAVGYPDPEKLAFIRQLPDHTAAGGAPRD